MDFEVAPESNAAPLTLQLHRHSITSRRDDSDMLQWLQDAKSGTEGKSAVSTEGKPSAEAKTSPRLPKKIMLPKEPTNSDPLSQSDLSPSRKGKMKKFASAQPGKSD
jgi:hypothetical protein